MCVLGVSINRVGKDQFEVSNYGRILAYLVGFRANNIGNIYNGGRNGPSSGRMPDGTEIALYPQSKHYHYNFGYQIGARFRPACLLFQYCG